MKTLNIKRTRQLFAFNQTINLFLDGKFCGKLMNVDNLSLNIKSEQSKLEAKCCFGSQAIVIVAKDMTPKNIIIQFGISDLFFVLTVALFIALGTTVIGLIWYVNINFSLFILLFTSFFIIRTRKQLRIIKK